MLMIGLAELYLWVACQNEFPTCNSGCNTFKVAAVTLNIRWHVRNSGAADPNTWTIKENVCKMLRAKITLVWHTNTFVFVWKEWLSDIQSENLKLEGFEVSWPSNATFKKKKNSLLLLYWSCFEYEQIMTEEEVCLHFKIEDSAFPFPLGPFTHHHFKLKWKTCYAFWQFIYMTTAF